MAEHELRKFKPEAGMYASRSSCRDVQMDLAAPFAGEESRKFICWVIQLVVAVGAAVGISRDYSDKLVRILSTHLCMLAFHCRSASPMQLNQTMLLWK